MTYLLIIFVIALALAPLSHFVPSKRQRQVARMREYAAVHGLFVEFRKPPESMTPRRRVDGQPNGELIYYGKRLPVRRKTEIQRARWLRESEGWRGLERGQAVPAPSPGLPVAVHGASVDEGSCGVYWWESREEEDVDGIRQFLETWSEQLCS